MIIKKYILLSIVIGLLFAGTVTLGAGFSVPNYWKLSGTSLSPMIDVYNVVMGNVTIGGVTTGDIDMGTDVIKNIGNAGTDFGSSGQLTLASTLTVGGNISMAGYDVTNTGKITGEASTASLTLAGGTANATRNIVMSTVNAAGDAQVTRLTVGSDADIATLTFTALTTDFDGESVINVGNAGNDFGATNTLVPTTINSVNASPLTLTMTSITGTDNPAIDITGGEVLNAEEHWAGIRVKPSNLDPDGVDTKIRGAIFDLSVVDISNQPESIDGIRIKMPTSSYADNHAIHISQGQVFQSFTALSDAGASYTPYNAIIDASSLNTNSTVHYFDVSTSGGTPAGDVYALGVHSNVGPIIHSLSSYTIPNQTEYAGEKTGGGVTWVDGIDASEIFVANSDEIYVGGVAAFSDIEVIFGTVATKNVSPTFWYNTAADVWTQFYPEDDTDGFQQSGLIHWTLGDISALWTNDGDPGAGDSSAGYWIKIIRTGGPDPGTPTPTTVKIGTATNYSWDKTGILTIKDVTGETFTSSDLTSGRITIAGASGVLTDDVDLSFSGAALTLGSDGTDGQLNLFSEQGATDYTASLFANAAMTSAASFYLPADEAGAESFLKMGTDGIIDYDTTTYLPLSGGTLTGALNIEHTGGIVLGEDIAGGTPNEAGYIKMFSSGDDAMYNTFTAGDNTANATYTLPVAMPASDKFLQSTSAGVMSWAAVSSGGLYGMNVETLSADKTLTADTDEMYQYLDEGGADRIITLSDTGAIAGDRFVIRHNGVYNDTHRLQIQNAAVNTTGYLYAGTIGEYIFDGSNWIAGETGSGDGGTLKNNIALGQQTKAWGGGTAIGYSADGYDYGVGLGWGAEGSNYGVAVGMSAKSNLHKYSTAIGYQSECERTGELSINIAGGDSDQENNIIVQGWEVATANNTPVEMEAGGEAGERFTIRASSVVGFTMTIVARDNVAGHVALYTIANGVIKRDASNNTAMAAAATVTTVFEDDAGWNVTVTADDTNEALIITVTGDDTNATQWAARMDAVETHF